MQLLTHELQQLLPVCEGEEMVPTCNLVQVYSLACRCLPPH